MEEFNLSDKFEEAFTDAKKVSFLKNTREVEVFKLALQVAFGFNKEFIKRLKEESKIKDSAEKVGADYKIGYLKAWTEFIFLIDKFAGDKLTYEHK